VFKNKALFVVAILVIALAVIASSCTCAPATPAAPAATPAAPAAPAATPAAPAATPAAPSAAVTHTWGDSKTYTNDEVGFTVTYPAKWITTTSGTDVLTVAAGSGGTDDTIHVTVIPAVTDFGAAVKGILDSSPAFVQYKVISKLDSSGPIKLASGSVTDAIEAALSAKVIVYQFYFYAVGATKGGKTVGVLGQTIGGGNAKKQIQEICQSLSFK
jgi:hypothetical protein